MSKCFKRISSLLLVVTFMLSLLSVNVFAEVPAGSYDAKVVFVHSNDVHARVDGEAYVSTIFKEQNKDGNAILVSAGDVLHGQTIATLSKGQAIVDIMNETGYSYLAPGNHDFNYGLDRLLELEKTMKFKILSANLSYKDNGKQIFTPYVVHELKNGLKIGIFGLTTPETATKTSPLNVVAVNFDDTYKRAAEAVKDLKAAGVDAIVCVAHLGLDAASEVRSDILAKEVPGIDLIIDGHSHTTLEGGLSVSGTLIAQTGSYVENIGLTSLYFKDKKLVAKESELTSTAADKVKVEKDAKITEMIAEKNKENEKVTSQVVATIPVKLVGEREVVRKSDSNLSNLITDAMLAATGADISITNGGGIRASIDAGEVTVGEVLTVLPFGNYVITKELKGSDVIKMFESGLDGYPELVGKFPEFSGVKIVFDEKAAPGSRITKITTTDGKAIDPAKTYIVATNDFMAIGGDGYSVFADAKEVGQYSALDEVLIEYLTKNPNVAKNLNETTDGRLSIGAGKTYIIKTGDTLWQLAKVFSTTWGKLAELNNITNARALNIGQEIVLP